MAILKLMKSHYGNIQVLVILVVVLLTIIGAYFLGQRKSDNLNPTPTSSNINSQYKNTTMGLTLKLPSGWVICDYSRGQIGVNVPPGDSSGCANGSSQYLITQLKYYKELALTPTTKSSGETFIDFIKRLIQTQSNNPAQLDLTVINDSTVIQKIKNPEGSGGPTQILYTQDSKNVVYIISKEGSFITTQNDSNIDPNLNMIASTISDIPVTTGDIAGQMLSQIERNNTFSNTGTLTNYPVILYGADQKTVISKTQTDMTGNYYFRVKPADYYINDAGVGWQKITVTIGDVQTFNGGTIIR